MFFLDEILFHDVAHINDLFLGDTQIALGILSSCVIHQSSYFIQIQTIPLFSYFFWWVPIKKLCKYVGTLWVQGDGSFIQGPLTRH
jgi:hypothetical protein